MRITVQHDQSEGEAIKERLTPLFAPQTWKEVIPGFLQPEGLVERGQFCWRPVASPPSPSSLSSSFPLILPRAGPEKEVGVSDLEEFAPVYPDAQVIHPPLKPKRVRSFQNVSFVLPESSFCSSCNCWILNPGLGFGATRNSRGIS